MICIYRSGRLAGLADHAMDGMGRLAIIQYQIDMKRRVGDGAGEGAPCPFGDWWMRVWRGGSVGRK